MTTSSQAYEQQIKQAMDGSKRFDITTVPEAQLTLKQIVQLQKELRQIKKEIGLTIKSIRAEHTDQKEAISKPGVGKGVMQGLFGKKTTAQIDASQKNRIRQNQQGQIAPYEALQAKIDRTIVEYDGQKMQIEKWVAEQSK